MARRATRPDPTSRPNGATDSRRRRSSARYNRPLRDGPATDNLTTCYSLRSSRAGHGVGDLPMEIEVIPESQDAQEPLDRPAKRGEPLYPPQHQGRGDTLQQKKRCEERAAVGKSFSGWHELNSTVGDACCRKTSQHRSSTSRADNEVSIAGDELSPQTVADSSRDDALGSSSAANGAVARGGEDRTQQTFRGENTTTEEVSRSSSSNNNCDGVVVQKRQSDLSDNGDEAKTPRQSHEVERGVINHVIVAGEGQQTTAASMVTSPDHWERKVFLDLTTDSVVGSPDAAPSAGARPSGETSVGNAMSPRVSPGMFPGVTCQNGERGEASDGFGEGAGGGGESRCFRKSGEKQLLFMTIANPGLCPNKESSNNLRERAWGIVRELVTRPTPVEVTLKDGNTETVTVALDPEQLTDHALKKRWQMYRGKYERRAKEHSKSQAAGKGVGEGPVGDLYLDDGSSESLWLAKAVRAWDAAKLEKRRNSAFAETAAAAAEAEAAITTEGCSRWEAREMKNASDGLVVAPTTGGVSLASSDLSEGSTKRAAGEASAMSPKSTPNKRPRTEVVGHDLAKDTCLQDNSGVSKHSIGEDNRDRDVGKGLVQVVEGAAGAGDPSGLDDLSASASVTAAAVGSDGGVLHPASSKACGDGTPLPPPSSLPRGWSTPKETPGGDGASAASLPSSGPRRAGDSGETLPVAEQLMSLLAQKTAAELEAKRVETDLKRAQAEALRRGGGRAPAEVAAPGRIAPVPRVGHAFGGLRDAASAADAPAVSMRDALSNVAGQVQGLRADVWSIRDESRRLREELRETNSGVRLLLERFAFSSSSYPSAGGAPSFGGGGGVAGASSPLTNDEVDAGHQHPRPPETDHFGAVAQGLGPVRW